MDKKSDITAYLKDPIPLKLFDKDLDFDSIKHKAFQKARTIAQDPILLAWYDGNTGRAVPAVECGREDKPAWIVYAESRGGDIVININDGEYIFIYRSAID